jgi:ketosteroid isomerase-like protein
MFARVDARDTDGFLDHLTPDVRFRFGNGDMIEGQPALRTALAGFWPTIAGLSHELLGVWQNGDVVTVELAVSYDRLDGASVTIPAAVLLRLAAGGKVRDYRIFYDISPVYAA